MHTRTVFRVVGLSVLFGLLLTTLNGAPLGTAVNYAGRLHDGSQPATGLYDFQVALYDDATSGVTIGPTLTLPGVGVTNGDFTLPLDFGPGAFNGDACWLETSVRTNGAASYALLLPRQRVGPIPYALYAANSPLPAGALTNNSTGVNLAGRFNGEVYGTFYGNSFGNWFGNGYGDGSGINNLNAAALATGLVPDARLSSNVARLNANQSFTGSNLFGSAGNRFVGAFAGDGSGLGNLSAASLTGTIPPASIGAGSITSAMLASAAVGAEQLAPGAVTSPALADGAVSAAKLLAAVTNWLAVTINDPQPWPAQDAYGCSVAATAGGGVLVGAFNYGDQMCEGTAYLFRADGHFLTRFVNPDPQSCNSFGQSVAAFGTDRVLVGTHRDGGAYIFSLGGALLNTFTNPTPSVFPELEYFGRAVAAVGTDRVLIGAERDDTAGPGAGAAYLFDTNGVLVTTFVNPRPMPLAASNYFGGSMAALGNDRVIIGTRSGFGYVVPGSAYLFRTDGTLLMTFTNPAPSAQDAFGCAVAAVGNDRVLIGASHLHMQPPAPGVAYLFRTDGTLLTTFTSPVLANGDSFGDAVAAVGSDRVLIGARDAAGGGAAYLFSTDGTLLASFSNPSPAMGDAFGISVAASGSERVIIGKTSWTQLGAAYLFDLQTYNPGVVADSMRVGSVTTANLADGAVTAAKISGVLQPNQIPDLDAAKLSSGTLADARLSPNVALLNGSQTFAADKRFAGPVLATNAGNQITGTFLGDGSGLGGVWSLAGNGGTTAGTQFLGTTDDQPLEVHVNATRALRVEPHPDGPNIIGGSANNSANGYAITIAGGVNNSSGGSHAFIGGGRNNTAGGDGTVVCGGEANTLYSGTWGALVGGQENWMELAVWSFVGGGHANEMVNAYRSVIGGGEGNRLYFNADASFIGCGLANSMTGPTTACAIVGGSHNQIGDGSPGSLTGMAIGGGRYNQIKWVWDEMHDSVIGGGYGNVMHASRSIIAGGLENEITLAIETGIAPYLTASTIGGGSWNRIESALAVIAGGSQNSISTNSDGSTIGGGVSNRIPAEAACATIPGGRDNRATNQAFAAGTRAQAIHSGAFVWADATDADFASTTANQFAVRASGGTRLYSDTNATVGVELAPGANAWSVMSDRNLKENIRPVDARRVLEKLNALAVTEWNLKSQAPGVRHLGPMAQDFAQAFQVGEDQRRISTSDADGVAFLAIQGLSQKLEERSQKLEAENAALTREVAELKKLVKALADRIDGGAK